jgi:hypothetical protein
MDRFSKLRSLLGLSQSDFADQVPGVLAQSLPELLLQTGYRENVALHRFIPQPKDSKAVPKPERRNQTCVYTATGLYKRNPTSSKDSKHTGNYQT